MTVGEKLKAKYSRRRRGPVEDKLAILEKEEKQPQQEEEEEAGEGGNPRRSASPQPEDGAACASKKVSFAILSEKYEPLGWSGEKAPAGEEARKGKKRKRKLKKYGKNVGKALQKGCRYLILGLQGLANAYSSPLGVAVSIATVFR
ncbi:required for drug-induced death protein 1 isoform X1 [Pogona vitticeps]